MILYYVVGCPKRRLYVVQTEPVQLEGGPSGRTALAFNRREDAYAACSEVNLKRDQSWQDPYSVWGVTGGGLVEA